jgi:S-adenosylmethionine hydrolase
MAPFISFLTDFGPDSAAAICRGVMLGIAPDARIVDISHSVRKYAIRDGAFLLWSALPWMPLGVHVAVVDPGVGTARRPIGLLTGRGDVLIGPDNGLLMPAAERLGGVREARLLDNRDWLLPVTSATFHGRDIFSPVAAHIAAGGAFALAGPAIATGSLTPLRFPPASVRPGLLETSVIYVDSFGNLRLSGSQADLAAALGPLEPGRVLRVEFAAVGDGPADGPGITEAATWARTFGEIPPGAPLVYEDSFGELAYADNQASVADRLGVGVDRVVRITLGRG